MQALRITLAAVLLAGAAWGQAGLVFVGPRPVQEELDVRAKQSLSVSMERIHLCGPIFSHYSSTDGNGKEYGECVSRPECEDERRLLVGPDGHGIYWCHLPQAEPMDVPAISHLEENAPNEKSGAFIKGFSEACTEWGNRWVNGKCESRVYTCTDKRRVLLTSQDGKHHCILFPAQP